MSGTGYDHAALMARLKELTRNAKGRLVDEIHPTDSDAVVAALGGGFKKEVEIKVQGNHVMLVLRGRNGLVAVANTTAGVVHGKIRIFEREEKRS